MMAKNVETNAGAIFPLYSLYEDVKMYVLDASGFFSYLRIWCAASMGDEQTNQSPDHPTPNPRGTSLQCYS